MNLIAAVDNNWAIGLKNQLLGRSEILSGRDYGKDCCYGKKYLRELPGRTAFSEPHQYGGNETGELQCKRCHSPS